MCAFILSFIMYLGSVPVSLLEELARTSHDLSPILKVSHLYQSAGMLSFFPVFSPVDESSDCRISSSYGYRLDPFSCQRKFHSGIDYACALATAVRASGAGRISFVGYRGGYGKCVEIIHSYGFTSLYGHLSAYYVTSGEYVPVGKVIGFVGSTGRSTGCHLHYEVRKDGKPIPPLFTR